MAHSVQWASVLKHVRTTGNVSFFPIDPGIEIMSPWNFQGPPCRHEVGMKWRKEVTLGHIGLLDPTMPKLDGVCMYEIQYIPLFNLNQLEGGCLLKDSQYSTSSETQFHLLPIGSPLLNLDASRDWVPCTPQSWPLPPQQASLGSCLFSYTPSHRTGK